LPSFAARLYRLRLPTPLLPRTEARSALVSVGLGFTIKCVVPRVLRGFSTLPRLRREFHMAQQMITLEEAAEKLGITPEEMKKRLKTDPDFKRLSQIRDGSTVRFKLSAIEELARELGMASEQELPLAPMEEEVPPGSDDFKVKSLDDKKKK